MAALPSEETRPRLIVIKGGKADVDWRLEEALVELASRRAEEQEFAAQVAPLLDRMELAARVTGPTAWRTVAAVAYLLDRHARRWADDDGIAA